ncbi:hypothetical protein C8J56DRAFT_1117436 [Mycena floridula]|nr:hypothetical protein C8J56DRAFT_1117436 [Mycena floridula]
MAGLKITTPSLLALASVPQNYTTNVDSTLNDPFLLGSFIRTEILSGLQKLMSRVPGFETGLLDNMLYDVLKNHSRVGTAQVNSHTMNVSCGAPWFPYPSNITATRPLEYEFKTPNQALITIPLLAPNVLSIGLDGIWTSFNVVDSTEKSAPQIRLNPPMNPFNNISFHNDRDDSTTPLNPTTIHALGMSAIYNLNVSSISFFSCFLTVSNSTIPVRAETGLPLESPERKTSSTWRDVNIQDQLLGNLWQPLMMSETSPNISISNIWGSNRAISGPDGMQAGTLYLPACQYLSQTESFILDAISVSPSTNQSWLLDRPISSDSAPSVKIATVYLHELEKAIEDYIAKLFWSALYLSDVSNTNQVPVFMTEIVSELQINLLPVMAGLVLSILLLIIAPALVGWKPNERYKSSVDDLGVLEILWLDGSREIADVKDPSTGNLRRAGMFVSADLSARRRWVD